jgi:Ca2+/H+ antiporter, TMEM165/GDT1 family
MLTTALSTFGVIFLAELPDKTALAALVLGTRLPTRAVVLGGWLAFLVQTVIAVGAGSLLAQLPSRPIHIVAGVGFLAFAILALRRNEEAEMEDEGAAASATMNRPPWLTAFLVIFAAEFGDLTQLATAALTAQSHQPVPVFIGALLALFAVTVIAAIAGNRAARFLSATVLQRVSAALFAVVGVVLIVTALR